MFYRASTLLFLAGRFDKSHSSQVPNPLVYFPSPMFIPGDGHSGMSMTKSKVKTVKSGAVHYWPYARGKSDCPGVIVDGACILPPVSSGHNDEAKPLETVGEFRMYVPTPRFKQSTRNVDIDKAMISEKDRILRLADLNQQEMEKQLKNARSDDVSRVKHYERSLRQREARLVDAEKKSRASREAKAKRLQEKRVSVEANATKLRAFAEQLKLKTAEVKAREEELAKQAEELKSQQTSAASQTEAAQSPHTNLLAQLQQKQEELDLQEKKFAERETDHSELQSKLSQKEAELASREEVTLKERKELTELQERLVMKGEELSQETEMSKQRLDEYNALADKLKQREDALRQQEESLKSQLGAPQPVLSGGPACVPTVSKSGVLNRCRRRSKTVVKVYA